MIYRIFAKVQNIPVMFYRNKNKNKNDNITINNFLLPRLILKMELKYGEALYFLDEVEYKEEYKEGDKIKIYILKKRDNQPWLDKIELEYIEKGNKWLKGGVFRKEYSDGWVQFDLNEWKISIITRKEWVALNEQLGCPDK